MILRADRWTRASVALLAAAALARLATIAAGPLGLSPDEAHYWEWSRRLDWSYYSKGPLVAWLIAASTSVLGSTEIGVRAPAVLLGLATGLAGVRLSLDTSGSGRAAFLSTLVATAMPLYAAGAMLMTIDAPFVCCWTFATLAAWRATSADERGRAGRWLACGCAVGVGFLAKYTMALFVPSVAIAILAAGRARPRAREAAIAIAAALVVASPIVLWNAAHDWVSLRHVLGQAGLAGGEPARRPLATAADFVGSQVGVVSPGIVIAIAVMTVRRLRAGGSTPAERFLLGMSLPTIAFFFLWSFHSKVQANWAAAGWLTAAIALGIDWDTQLRACATLRSRRRLLGLAALALAPGAVAALVVHTPDLPRSIGLALPARLDPTSRLRGWRELGAGVGELAVRDGTALPIAAASYQTTSELAFYVPGQPTVVDLDLGNRRRNQHDLWGGAEALEGRDVAFVADGPFLDPPPELRRRCASVERRAIVTLVAPAAPGDPGRAASVFLCGGYRSPLSAAPPGRY